MFSGREKKVRQNGLHKKIIIREVINMNINNLPVKNEKLMSFHLEFIGTDLLGGERHFLEHTMLNTNKLFTKEQLHRNLTFLGGGLFNACTSQERIMFSGTYLKEDEEQVWKLLRPIVNDCLFLNEEIEKERKIILEELRVGKDQIFQQMSVSLGKLLNKELCILGSEQAIKAIQQDDLKLAYRNLISDDCATMFVQNCFPPKDLFAEQKNDEVGLIPIVPSGKYEIENDQMSSSVSLHTFDSGYSLPALLLEDYLGSASGPLFKNIREKRQLCYMVGAMTDFVGDFKLSPYFTLYVVSNSDIQKATEALMEEFIVDDVELYDSLRKKHTLEMEKSKASFRGQMGLLRRSQLTGIALDSLIESIPTWEEFKTYSEGVKENHIGTFKIIGTKK